MNLNAIYERLSEINEIKIIGKDFRLGDTECHLAGFYRGGNVLHGVLLTYNETLRDLKEQAEIEAMNSFDLNCEPEQTVRECEKAEIRFIEPSIHIKELICGETTLKSGEAQCTQLSNDIESEIILLSEFIRAGWISERFEYISFDDYYINDITFDGEYEHIPEIAGDIMLSFAPQTIRSVAEIPVLLKIGNEEIRLDLPDGDCIYIRETKLIDMYAETEKLFANERFRQIYSPEEIERERRKFIKDFSPLCPKGKFYAAVEYEAADGISVDIKLKSVLDAPPVPRSSCMAFFLKSDLAPLREGMKVKTAVIDFPLDGDTNTLDAEIFSVFRVEIIKDMVI